MKNGPNTSADGGLSGRLSRRELVAGAAQGAALGALGVAGVTLSGAAPFRRRDGIPTVIRGAGAAAGHLLRGGVAFPAPSTRAKTRIAIVGGGVAGLSAAWWLTRQGVNDHVLLELEDAVGGSARGGGNAVSAYPWGAHYLPIPGRDARYVRLLLEDAGIIRGYDAQGRPFYDETALCGAPHERLMLHGRWQEGILPQLGASADDRRQYGEFAGMMTAYRAAVGADGKRAFTIPVDASSADPVYRALDGLTMAGLFAQRGWTSPYLRWYVEYCCRDDFGTTMAETSAWAGVHYFAARNGDAANADDNAVLTWPEGNARLVAELRARGKGEVRTGAVVHDVRGDGPYEIDYVGADGRESHRVEADAVIFAAPRFVAAHVLAAYRAAPPAWAGDFTYAPWMVANVTLENLPDGEKSEEARAWRFAWDNVSYTSDSLGYVNATHQSLAAYHRATVLTHYWPLTGAAPKDARAAALARTPAAWRDQILDDLDHMHAGIEEHVASIDVWLWGHGMVRPTKGFLWGESRAAAQAPLGRIFFAHSDMSGLSIFEEAQYRGVEAAAAAIGALA